MTVRQPDIEFNHSPSLATLHLEEPMADLDLTATLNIEACPLCGIPLGPAHECRGIDELEHSITWTKENIELAMGYPRTEPSHAERDLLSALRYLARHERRDDCTDVHLFPQKDGKTRVSLTAYVQCILTLEVDGELTWGQVRKAEAEVNARPPGGELLEFNAPLPIALVDDPHRSVRAMVAGIVGCELSDVSLWKTRHAANRSTTYSLSILFGTGGLTEHKEVADTFHDEEVLLPSLVYTDLARRIAKKRAPQTTTVTICDHFGSSPRERDATVAKAVKTAAKTPVHKVLVHADGGDCHGAQLVFGHCPGCGIVPDSQSTELWTQEAIDEERRARERIAAQPRAVETTTTTLTDLMNGLVTREAVIKAGAYYLSEIAAGIRKPHDPIAWAKELREKLAASEAIHGPRVFVQGEED